MKNNIQSSNSNNNSSLNPKPSRHSRVLKQSQSVDFLSIAITGLSRVTIFTVLALSLMSKPYVAYAGESPVISKQQAVAEKYAQEIGGSAHARSLEPN